MSKPPYNVAYVAEIRALFTDPVKLSEFDRSYALVANDFVESSMLLHRVECRLKGWPATPKEVEEFYKKHDVITAGETEEV
jgi:hypothetical protein